MRIALLISGHERSFGFNVLKLQQNIIQDHSVDVYIYLDRSEDKYNNMKCIIEHLGLNIISFIQEKACFNDNSLLNQAYKIQVLYNHMVQRGINYDVIIRFRPDINIDTRLDFGNLDHDTIYIPEDAKVDISRVQQPYLCDGLAYGTPAAMHYYCSWFEAAKMHYGYEREESLYLHLQGHKYMLVPINYFYLLSNICTISISGDSGVGKSVISETISKLFKNPLILECDRYHKWERGSPYWNSYTHLNPDANYLIKMHNDVFDLKIRKTIYQVNYDHSTGKFTEAERLSTEHTDTLIVCGLHSQYTGLCDIKIYVDATDEIKRHWKMARDTAERNRTIEDIQNQINQRKPDFASYIDIQKGDADIVISYYGTTDNIHLMINEIEYCSVTKTSSLQLIGDYVRNYLLKSSISSG